MDDSGHRENGRQKQQPQGQWLMQHHPSMKQIIAIMAERDAALQERNLAISEKKAALAERDLAILQRDSAIAERNSAIMERDNTIAALQYRESAMSSGNISSCPPGCQVSHGVKHIHHPHQQHLQHHQSHIEESSYISRDLQISEGPPVSPIASEPAKSRQTKRPKEEKPKAPKKKPSKPSKKVKKEGEDLNKMMFSHDWGMEDDQNKQLAVSKPNDWKGQDLGLNQIAFDESMPVPVCSCTGVLRPCYRWGSGGWQSSCCTTTVSMYPLPAAPNKRHARVGGRKMSGNVFTKLLNRLASEGHDLSRPVDLKEHWAKHGTNRYITIK